MRPIQALQAAALLGISTAGIVNPSVPRMELSPISWKRGGSWKVKDSNGYTYHSAWERELAMAARRRLARARAKGS